MRIYTIGHSNHPAGRFLELLEAHRIEVVADTRSTPFSRFSPHYNRAALERLLAARSMEYLYLGAALGGRPPAPAELLREGIERAGEEAARKRVALLCSEEDPRRCHRHLLLAAPLADLGFEVVHIRGDARLETDASLAPLFSS